VTSVLNQQAANNGLEYVIETFHTTQSSRVNTNTINLESRRTVSRALAAYFRERPVPAVETDSFLASDLTTGGYLDVQWRAGSLYFPTTALRQSTGILNAPECYAMMARNFSVGDGVGVSPEQYIAGHGVLGVSLERSSTLDSTGVPLSNSRTLALNCTFENSPSSPMNISLFLQHMCLIRCFLSSTSLEI
jgi:hypothetical protein